MGRVRFHSGRGRSRGSDGRPAVGRSAGMERAAAGSRRRRVAGDVDPSHRSLSALHRLQLGVPHGKGAARVQRADRPEMSVAGGEGSGRQHDNQREHVHEGFRERL